MTMEALRHRILKAVHPEHGAQPPEKWQQRKSAQTRLRLIEAGVDCLVENGYAGLTTAAVAERCEVSRGAMHHHFATRAALVSAVVDHVFYRRMYAYLDAYLEAAAEHGDTEMIEIASDLHWSSLHSREYAAYLALAIAARSEAELAEQFIPAARRYDEVWTSEMIEAFPLWSEHWESLKLASDLTLTAQMGMLLHEPVFGSGERMERLRRFVTQAVKDLHAHR